MKFSENAVDELVESFINGNITYVAEEIIDSPKRDAIMLAACVAVSLKALKERKSDHAYSFLRILNEIAGPR